VLIAVVLVMIATAMTGRDLPTLRGGRGGPFYDLLWSFGSSSTRALAVHSLAALGADMHCKTDKIRAAWAAGDRIGALRIAARFFDRSDDTKIFKRGMDAHNNPGFYRQLGKEPERIVGTALEALARRFSLR
jgi:hypothetical protein